MVQVEVEPWSTGLGEHVTEPPADGFAVAVMVYWFTTNVAVQLLSVLIVTSQERLLPQPEQSPSQPVNEWLEPGWAVRVTVVMSV